jgi:hypothetical protein
MDNHNKDWLNSANSYRPVEGANQLADEINGEMQELKSGNVENLDDFLARLQHLREKCLKLAPLTEDAPQPKPTGKTNPMGVGNEWAYTSFNLGVAIASLRAGETLTEECLTSISQLAFSAASRSARHEKGNSGS